MLIFTICYYTLASVGLFPYFYFLYLQQNPLLVVYFGFFFCLENGFWMLTMFN